MAERECVFVGVRVRPFAPKEDRSTPALQIQMNEVTITQKATYNRAEGSNFRFAYDAAMDSRDHLSREFVSQDDCYEIVASGMVDELFAGFKCAIMAYGQTGSGKTTTMIGNMSPPSEQGLLLRFVNECFQTKEVLEAGRSTHVTVSMQVLEVYNDKVRDLLNEDDIEVHVRYDPAKGVFLEGATSHVVTTIEDCMRILAYGNTRKMVAATAMNANSSRGHAIYRLIVEKMGAEETTSAEAYFVDLAGRENERTTLVKGDRFIELTFINKSLFALSQCLEKLLEETSAKPKVSSPTERASQMRKSTVIESTSTPRKSGRNTIVKPQGKLKENAEPTVHMSVFRNSKLTMLLAPVLDGKSKVVVIGTVSPAMEWFDESVSTLKFVASLKKLKVSAVPVIKSGGLSALEMEEEIKTLRAQLYTAQRELDALRSTGMPQGFPTDLGPSFREVNKIRAELEEERQVSAALRQQLAEANGVENVGGLGTLAGFGLKGIGYESSNTRLAKSAQGRVGAMKGKPAQKSAPITGQKQIDDTGKILLEASFQHLLDVRNARINGFNAGVSIAFDSYG